MAKKIIIAADSFKGCLTSSEVAAAVAQGIGPEYDVEMIDIADGGEGTARILTTALGGEMIQTEASDPLGRRISAEYGLCGGTAIIETAEASGLSRLTDDERNPLLTNTFGTGELIREALLKGAREFIIGLGGSATNDAGMGMLMALGCRFLDAYGNVLEGRGGDLLRLDRIDVSGMMPEAREAHFRIICDVDVPFCGPVGAAYMFGPQKGAIPVIVEVLDMGLSQFAETVKKDLGCDINVPGSGAAGGLGGAFKAFLNSELVPGIEAVLDSISFDERIKDADLLITGEGCLDLQTTHGKAVAGILKRAKNQDVPVLAIAGRVEECPELDALGFVGMHAISNLPINMAMKPDVAKQNITDTIKGVIANYL